MFEFRGQGWIGHDKAAFSDFSPNADGGLGAERSLVAHLLSRGHAELVCWLLRSGSTCQTRRGVGQ